MAVAPSRLGSLLLVAVAVSSLGLVRCYGATELVLDLRTNLACETFQPITQIRTGNSQVVAETSTCDASPAEDRTIGTLTFVPSGDRDAKMLVEVVLAVKGGAPGDCDSQPDRCIVAKRSVSFIEHSSRHLPVVLRSQCLGKVCGAAETCVKGGVCVLIETACLIEGCFADITPTTTGEPVATDAGTAGCTNGDVQCVGVRLEQCAGGTFELRDLCETPELCQGRSGTSCATASPVGCKAREQKCDGNRVLECRSDGAAFDTLMVCKDACSAVAGAARCVRCIPGERVCDSACSISGPGAGTSADDCLLRCAADGSALAFEQNCGVAQHGIFSDSCRPAPANGGAECF